MPSIKSFAAPHKGLRNIISQFSVLLGYTDFSNSAELEELKQLGDEMFTLLKDHVHTENEYTLRKLEERMPGASEHDKEDHLNLEIIQDSLETRLVSLTGAESADEAHQLYLDFTSFQSLYLEHIYEEETVTELLLQQNFSDEELISHRIEIMQRIELPVLKLWLKYIVPAQIISESIAMLKGLKASLPEELFADIMYIINKQMSSKRFHQLVSGLN